MTTDREQVVKAYAAMRLASIAAFGVLAGSGSGPLAAQAEDPAPHVCTVSADAVDSDGMQTVRAGCWGTGLILGKAEAFQTLSNSALPATLAVLSSHGAVRILLLHEAVDGQPMVEDLGSALAAAGGRGPLGSVADLPVDFTQFETTGVIGVGQTGETVEATSETASPASARAASVQERAGVVPAVVPGSINVGALIANDPARASAQADQ